MLARRSRKPTTSSATTTRAVATAAAAKRPAPQAIPMEATTHTLAALVSPLMRLPRLCRMRPAPRKPMPCTIFEATWPLLGLVSPASTADRSVKKAAPMQMSMFVRTPADLRLTSRSRPMIPPRRQARARRENAPLTTTTCSSQEKSNGSPMCARTELKLMVFPCPMLSLLLPAVDHRGIGDVNRSGGLAGGGIAADFGQVLRVLFYRLVNLIAIKRDDDGGILGRGFECGSVEGAIAFVNRLAKRNAGKGHEVGVDRRFHQDEPFRSRGKQFAKNGRNLLLERPARFDVLYSFDISEGLLRDDFPGIPNGECANQPGSIANPLRLELPKDGEYEVRYEPKTKRKGRQQFHAVACVVPGVRPPLRNEDGNRPVGNGISVEGHWKPEEQCPEKGTTTSEEAADRCAKKAEHEQAIAP